MDVGTVYLLLVNQTEAGLTRFAGNTNNQTGLCPIHVSKQLLNRPGRFAGRPDTRFGRAFRPASKSVKT